MRPLLSICVPSYNRPNQLSELLLSIDCNPENIEIVICEDQSPQRQRIRAAVELFKNKSFYQIRYFENEKNLGYDGNLRRLVEQAAGQFVMFMGDDDLFIEKKLDHFLRFLTDYSDNKYVLRSHIVIHPSGHVESFRYLPATKILPSGEETVAWLFKRSVSISGFTISRDEAFHFATDKLDGTLLYQIYLMAQVCLHNESVYCDIPITRSVKSYFKDQSNFGNALAERDRYTPGKITLDNSINFTKSYFELTDYLDKMHGTHLTWKVKVDLSKYSYPFLSIQRKNGINSFLRYAKKLEQELDFGCTPYYYLYKWGLVFFGEKFCDHLILFIKNRLGYTPNF
jgi:glycosyltransferase involved in cell wall biosynthesis